MKFIFVRSSAALALGVAALLALPAADALAFERGGGRSITRNADGGVTGSAFRSGSGANGGGFARNRNTVTDGAGNGTSSSIGSFNTARGASGESSGSASRNADGSYNASRSSTATGANGTTYNGSTTATNGSISHSGSCTDASGAAVACR